MKAIRTSGLVNIQIRVFGGFRPRTDILMKNLIRIVLPVALLLVQSAYAQQRQLVQEDSRTEKRIALVIGNSAYVNAPPLKNPVNDAQDMAQALRGLSFDVIYRENLNQNDMKRAIREFGAKIRNGGVGLFYYAGHGVAVKGINYLVPVDAEVESEEEVEYECVNAGFVLAQMDSAANRLNVVILDACRNNPFARSFRSGSRGLAQMDAPTGTLIAYATAPGSVASDGNGRNGLYTSELLKQMKEPGVPVELVFKRVGMRVSAATSGRQEPWIALSLRGDFYFVAGSNASAELASSVNIPPPIKSNRPPTATGPTSISGANFQDANAIARNDIGPLRVILKSVMPIKLKDQNGQRVNGIRCSFKFINLETQRPIVVAMNANPSMRALGDRLRTTRTTLLDERGTVWGLSISDVTGISIVSVGNTLAPGVTGRSNYSQSANPAEIASLLQRQDETGTNMTSEPDRPDLKYAFVFGSTTPIPPGQSVTVVMNFVQDAGETTSGPSPKSFQFVAEIVIGVVTTDTKKSYSLHNVLFDRVSLPSRGS